MHHSTLALVFVVACGAAPAEPHSSAAPRHWGYEAANGPAHWAAIDSAFATCASGHEQSPIDVPAAPSVGEAALSPTFHLVPVPLRFVDNGHTIQVNADGASTVQVGATTYALAQFHFHVPSEHTIAGKSFDAELHAVHKSAEGHLLVIGLMLTKGDENRALAPLFAALPAGAVGQERVVPNVGIALAAVATGRPRFIHYAGSLTTPPCTEGVEWYVIDPAATTGTISEAQLASLARAVHGDNHRPAQPLGTRAVVTVP